jgi:hypothetical protein
MLKDLQDLGIQALYTRLTRICKKLSLICRITTLDKEAADTQLLDILRAELDDRRIASYRRRYLYLYFKQQGHLVNK